MGALTPREEEEGQRRGVALCIQPRYSAVPLLRPAFPGAGGANSGFPPAPLNPVSTPLPLEHPHLGPRDRSPRTPLSVLIHLGAMETEDGSK